MSLTKLSIEEKFSREVTKAFSPKRIVSLLYFGTRAYGLNINDDSDYDLMLILDKYALNDTRKLRRIIHKHVFANVKFDLNLLYLFDIKTRGVSNFQIRALSLPFYKYLENARVLIGKNIFSKSPIKLNRRTLKMVNGSRIQEFYGRCDMLYFQSITDEKLYLQLRKYTKDIMWFILCGLGIIELKDLTRVRFEEILLLAKDNKILTSPTYRKFLNLLKKGYTPTNLIELESIRRQLYSKYLQLYS